MLDGYLVVWGIRERGRQEQRAVVQTMTSLFVVAGEGTDHTAEQHACDSVSDRNSWRNIPCKCPKHHIRQISGSIPSQNDGSPCLCRLPVLGPVLPLHLTKLLSAAADPHCEQSEFQDRSVGHCIHPSRKWERHPCKF